MLPLENRLEHIEREVVPATLPLVTASLILGLYEQRREKLDGSSRLGDYVQRWIREYESVSAPI